MSEAMMKLRDGIDTIMSTGIDAREASRDEWQSCIDTGVEAIIAIVREAMLSDAAVEAACRGSVNSRFSGWDAWQEVLDTPVSPPEMMVANGIHFDTGEPDEVRRQERSAITAALDAAFGPASDQHGEGTG